MNVTPPPAVTLEDIVLVDERLKVSCIGFWLAGIGTLLCGIALTVASVFSIANPELQDLTRGLLGPPDPGIIHFLGPIFLITWILPLITAHSLRRHRNYHLAVVLLLTMLVPVISPLFIVQIPLAIWALVVLCFPTTRKVFRTASIQARLDSTRKPAIIKQIPTAVFATAIIGAICDCRNWNRNVATVCT